MQNTAFGAHVAGLKFHSITWYDLINLLEHIIQSAQHLTPHLCTAAAAAGWALIGRGEDHGAKHNISCGRRRDLDGPWPCLLLSFCLSFFFFPPHCWRPSGPNYSHIWATPVLLTRAPTVNLEERRDQAPAPSWNWQSYLLCCHGFPALVCRWEMTEGQNKLSEASMQINQSWRIVTAFVGGLILVKHRSRKEKMRGGFASSATMRGITQAEAQGCNNAPVSSQMMR